MKPALSSLLLLTPVLLMGCSHQSQPVQAATPTAQAQLVEGDAATDAAVDSHQRHRACEGNRND